MFQGRRLDACRRIWNYMSVKRNLDTWYERELKFGKQTIYEKSCNACISYKRAHVLKFVLHSSHSVISKCQYMSFLNKAAFFGRCSLPKKRTEKSFLFYYISFSSFYENFEQSLWMECPVVYIQAKRGCPWRSVYLLGPCVQFSFYYANIVLH